MKRSHLLFCVTVLAVALFIVPVFVMAQPGGAPPTGNVNATFNSVTINNGAADTLSLATDGTVSNANGPVNINDTDGVFIKGSSAVAPVVTVTGVGAHNAKLHSDGWLTGSGGFHLGGDGTFGGSKFIIFADGKIMSTTGPVTLWDADGMDVRGKITNGGGKLTLDDDADGIQLDSDTTINNDLTVYNNVTAWNTVDASEGDFSWHLRARKIGNHSWSHIYYKSMAPNAATDFNADLSAGILTCAKDSVAAGCNFSVYNGTAGCGSGTPSGGINKNAAYPTYISSDPIWNSNYGGTCSMTLYNKTGGWMCGRVELNCWDPDGT